MNNILTKTIIFQRQFIIYYIGFHLYQFQHNIHTNGIALGVILNLNPWSFQPLLTPSDPLLSSMIKYYIILTENGH